VGASGEQLKRLKGPENTGFMLADLHLQTASIGNGSGGEWREGVFLFRVVNFLADK
jgi:hypothetical protein